MTEIYKGLDKLNPNFKKKVQAWMNEVGEKIFITESRRSQQRQDELYAKGRTTEGKIVTRTKHSNHTDGLAVDIAFYGENLYPSGINIWEQIADIAEKYGINWGYNLRSTDKPHFEDDGTIFNTNEDKMAKYETELNDEINLGFIPLLKTHEGDDSITEKEVKNLGEIISARLERRMKDYIDNKFASLKNAL